MALNFNDGTNPPDEHERLRAQVRNYVAGSDPTQPGEGATLTPGQLWHRLLHAPVEERLRLLRRALEADHAQRSCLGEDHVGRLAHLQWQLTDVHERLRGALGFDDTQAPTTLDGLATAVQALRNVMVDGLTGRATIEYAGREPSLDDLPEFPVEAGLQDKIGESLKAAGIDLQSVCGYEWHQDAGTEHGKNIAEEPHRCGLTNPLHAIPHACSGCAAVLTHEDAERLVNG